MKRIIKKETPAREPYTMQENDYRADEFVYVFEDSMDKSVIAFEQGIAENEMGEITDDVLETGERMPSRMEINRRFMELQEYCLNTFSCLLIILTVKLLQQGEVFQQFLENLRKGKVKLIFACTKSLQIRSCFGRFLLENPVIAAKEIAVDLEAFVKNRWKIRYGREPEFDVGVMLRKLRSRNMANARGVINALLRMERSVSGDDQIPTFDMIDELFVSPVKSWRERLDSLAAMEKVKKEILELLLHQIYCHNLAKNGMHPKERGIRLLVTGDPGCGKSTILDILKQALEEEGLTKREGCHISARMLIGHHIGESDRKVQDLFMKHDFIVIDELGGLNIEESFTQAVIQNLVYLLEDHEEVHVVFIGYRSDCESFFEKNKGLRSRINSHINIENYRQDELVEIGKAMLKQRHYEFDMQSAGDELKKFADQIVKCRDYGNARAVRNLMEHLEMVKAEEYETTKKLDMKVTQKQLEMAVERYFASQVSEEQEKKAIGFALKE